MIEIYVATALIIFLGVLLIAGVIVMLTQIFKQRRLMRKSGKTASERDIREPWPSNFQHYN